MEGSALAPVTKDGVDLNSLLQGMPRWATLMKEQTQAIGTSAWSRDRPDQTPTTLVPYLFDSLARWAYTHVFNSYLIEEIRVADDVRTEYHLNQMFSNINIGHLLDGRDGYCRNLVAQFFANLHCDNDKLISWVNGVPILLSVKKFGEIVGVPTEGKETNNEKCDDWEPDRLFSELFKNPRVARSHAASSLPATDMKPQYRVIHRLLQYLCLPKHKNHKFARMDSCQVMYAMAKKIGVNVASYMFRGLTEPSVNIPFPCTLTLIFVEYGINLEAEYLEFFCKTFTSANVNKLMPKSKGQRADATAAAVEEEEGEITMSSLKYQLDRMEGTQKYHMAYDEAFSQEVRYNAQQLHAKIGQPYKSFPLPRRQDFPFYEEPAAQEGRKVQETPRRRSTRRSTQQSPGTDEGASGSAARTRSKGKKKMVVEEEEEEEWVDSEEEEEEQVTPLTKRQRMPVKKVPSSKARR